MITTACSGEIKYKMFAKNQSLTIEGFTQDLDRTVYLLRGLGRRFRDLGISDGTLLLCARDIAPKDGDLVIRMCGEEPTLCIYRPHSKEAFEGLKPVLNDGKEVDAVVVCSFNFYQ